MHRKKSWIAVLIVGVVAAMVLSLRFYSHRAGQQVTILTGREGGTYYPLGRCLAQIIEQLPGQPIKDANAVPTDGSIANIERLLHTKDNVVAFTMASDLLRITRAEKEKLRILARLYRDVMHVVVRKDARIETIGDLRGKRIFLGPTDGGTRAIARAILKQHGLEDCREIDAISFNDAASKLINEELDAAFCMAGTPTEAVEEVLQSGTCDLLSLDALPGLSVAPNTQIFSTEQGLPSGIEALELPEMVYGEYQPTPITTLASDVFLVCRSTLDKDLAAAIVKGLFYDTERLELAHAKALEIKLTDALDVENPPLKWHLDGIERFLDETLLIATGAMKGYYYHLGRHIQKQLVPWGISAVTIHTDGSIENASLLSRKDRHTIAIMQYDATLAAQDGSLESIYGESSSNESIAEVEGIRRIATLHEEQVHVVMRRTRLNDIISKYNAETDKPIEEITSLDTLRDKLEAIGEKIDVCVGPVNSGTRVISRAILEQHVLEDSVTQHTFAVSDMVDRLHKGDLDAGFFVSHVPTGALRSVVEDAEAFSLLSLGSKERGQMRSGVFKMSTIEPNTYSCLLEGQMIRTIATRAVLVTTDNLRFPVRDITEAIFHGEAYLGIEGLTKETMAERLPSLPLHSDAEKHYKTEEVLGLKPPPMHWLRRTWTILGCLTMLITIMLIPGYTGLIVMRRSRTGNEIGRRILGIPLEASARDSVQRLLNIRDEIQKRVRRRWWRWGEIDKHRWRYLRDLIHDRIGEAKENLTRAFVAEIRDMAHNPELDKATRKQRCRSIEGRILEYFEKAELDPSQQKMLRELLRETIQQDVEERESKGGKK